MGNFENWVSRAIFVHVFMGKKNKSDSISIQIISKSRGKYKVVKNIGYDKSEQEIQEL